MELEISKLFQLLLPVFIGSHPNFMRPLLTIMEKCRLLLSWQYAKFYNIFDTLNFQHGSQWENLKCGICRKLLIVEWNGRESGTQGIVYICGVYWWLILWVWFGVTRCTLQNFLFYDYQNTTLPISIPISSQLYTRYHNHGSILAITFLAICQEWKKIWQFEVFLKTGPYAPGNFRLLFLPQFSLEPIQSLWEHWLPW